MMKSFKDLNCFSRMINSIMSITQKNQQNDNQNKNNSKLSQKKKKSRKLDKKNKTDLTPTSNANSKTQSEQNNVLELKQTPKFASIKNSQIINDPNSKQPQPDNQIQPQIINQGEPQTQRSLINKSINQLSEPSESNENDLPTQKSDIIMNYIGKSVNHNQIIFMNQSKEDILERFENIYEKIKLVRSGEVYQEFKVKKRSTDAFFHAYIMRDFEVLSKAWGLDQREAIQRYTELYETEKIHIQNSIQLQKIGCHHLAKLTDYELRPPTYDMTSRDRKFSQGSIAIVFENVEQTLQEFLADNNLDKSQKKKVVYQLITCLGDVHNSKMRVRDLSLKNFYIDRFQNVKFISLQVQYFGCYTRSVQGQNSQTEQNQVQQRLLYKPPEQLPLNLHQQTASKNSRSSYFHSGFSTISNFDSKEATEEQQDLWRLGVMIGKILTGKFIFSQQKPQIQKKEIIQVLTTQEGELISSVLKQKLQGLLQGEIQIIGGLMKLDPSQRRSCKELLESNYLQNLLEQEQ